MNDFNPQQFGKQQPYTSPLTNDKKGGNGGQVEADNTVVEQQAAPRFENNPDVLFQGLDQLGAAGFANTAMNRVSQALEKMDQVALPFFAAAEAEGFDLNNLAVAEELSASFVDRHLGAVAIDSK